MAKTPGVAFYGKVRIPTIGHKTAIDAARGIANKVGGKLTIGLSGTSEPLDLKTKKAHAEKVFGHPVNTGTPETKTLSSFLSHLNKSHDELHLVAGSDRVPEYKSFIDKYNGKKDKKGKVPFHFKKVEVHTAGGERVESNKDPRKMSKSELTSSVSASKLEKMAKEGNWEHFKAYHPGMPEAHVRRVFTQIRAHHGLNKLQETFIKEDIQHKEFGPMLDSFVDFASKKLGIESMPKVRFKDESDDYNSFAAYNPSKNELSVSTKDRHPMDVFRSVAHELVHHKQNEDGMLGHDIEKEGSTGSDIENEANAEAGKIMRWFAKSNPDMFSKTHIVEETITEGINDPGKLKAIFLAGGPGSGKDYVMNATLAGEGLREVNSDIAFEYLMNKNGLDLEMPDDEKVERNIVRKRAKGVTRKQQARYLQGRLGVIINGTADDLEKIKAIKQQLEYGGYETMMVFVNTSNEVSRQRNVERGKMGKRKVPDGTDKQGVPDGTEDIRTDKWQAAQQNIGELQKIFGNNNFAVIDNTTDIRKASPEEKEKALADFSRVRRMAQQFVRADNQNPRAKKWIEQEKSRRGITDYQPPKRSKTLTQIRQSAPNVVHKPDNELMAQARRLGLSYYGFGRFGRKVGKENKVLFHSQGGRLVRVQQMNEEKKMKNDPCWKGYQMVGKKKKGGKEVPNCVPVDANESFEGFMNSMGNKPSEREIGTNSLTKVYSDMTPGQTISEKKLKLKRKVLSQEAQEASVQGGYNFGPDGIGPTFAVPRAGTPFGFGYGGAYSAGISESIQSWMESEKTQQKFLEKYGNLWEDKLVEAALRLEEAGCGCSHGKEKKLFGKMREGMEGGVNNMGTVPTQRKDEEQLNERGADSKGLYRSTESGAGLTRKGAKHFGIKTAVTTPPSKLDPDGKAAKRRKSFCARMGGMPGPMKDEKGRPTRKAMSLRRWNCEE